MSSYDNLSEVHKRFVDSYIHCLCYRVAYQDAYPLANANTANVNGSRLAAKPEVKQAIVEQLKLYSKDKAETLLAKIQLEIADIEAKVIPAIPQKVVDMGEVRKPFLKSGEYSEQTKRWLNV